jgi:hypothetical protein
MIAALAAALLALQAEDAITVAVDGEVAAPNRYVLHRGSRVLDALSQAGGVLIEEADLQRARLYRRECSQAAPLNLHRMLRLGDLAQNFELRDGDRLHIPALSRRYLWFHADGGSYPLRFEPGLTLGEALRRVGWHPVGSRDKVSIERVSPGRPEPEVLTYSVDGLLVGPDPPVRIVLREGDIIHVSKGSLGPPTEQGGGRP